MFDNEKMDGRKSMARVADVCPVLFLAMVLLAAFPVQAQFEGVLWHQKISDTEGGFAGGLDAGDRFASTTGLGDLDGDGVPDLAVGAAWDDDGGEDRGAVWILFLNADGTVHGQQKIGDSPFGGFGDLDPGDRFGYSVSALGDLDLDGVPDLAVGSPFDDDGGDDQGAFYMMFLNEDGTLKGHQKVSATEGGFDGEIGAGSTFGLAMALGDLDGDGVVDLCVGEPEDDDGGPNHGAVWVLFMNSDGTVKAHQKISDTEGGFDGDLDDNDYFCIDPSPVGDVDGDGMVDLAVGAQGDDDGGTNCGAVYLLFLSPGVVSLEDPESEDPPTGGETLPTRSRLVRRFDLSDRPAGSHSVHWDGVDVEGRTVPSGMHLVRLETAESSDVMRVTLIK